MTRAALLLALLACPADAAPVRLYTPGGAPCAGLCALPWAADAFGVPVGQPRLLTIPAGTLIVWMSYARDGVAHATRDNAAFADDQPGQGYPVEGTPYWIVQINECQNWALVILPMSPIGSEPNRSQIGAGTEPGGYTPPGSWQPPCCVTPEEPPVEPPAPVPLGGTAAYLAAGLAIFLRRRG